MPAWRLGRIFCRSTWIGFASNLEMLPLVRAVEVRRMLPDRLFIRVDERTAVARLRVATREMGDETFYIDRAGL